MLSFELRVPNNALLRGGLKGIVDEELRAATRLSIGIAKEEVAARTPTSSGNLLKGWRTRLTGQNVSLRGELYNVRGYVQPVEKGSRPHWPPVGALDAWVRRTLGVSGAEVARVAFLVSRKIAQRGTRARNMVRDGVRAARGPMRALFLEATARIKTRLTK